MQIENNIMTSEIYKNKIASILGDKKDYLLKNEIFPNSLDVQENSESMAKLDKKPIEKDTKNIDKNNRRLRSRNNLRYKTQPITLIEIKEIEEESYNNNLGKCNLDSGDTKIQGNKMKHVINDEKI